MPRPPSDDLEAQRAFYLPRLAEHGDEPAAVGWLRSLDQTVRFEILTVVAGFEGLSVLDVGCGLGHLYGWLRDRGHRGGYLGIDRLPEMVDGARRLYPDAAFEAADIRDPACSFHADAVIANGLLALSPPADRRLMIEGCFRACRVLAAFNALSTWNPKPPPPPFHHLDPVATVDQCRPLTPYVMLRHDYSVQDFTVYLFRGVHTPMSP